MPATNKRKKADPSSSRLNLPDGTGRAGEAAAADILRRNDHRILLTNYRVREGEIDLVTRHESQIVFVEVKTRRSSAFGIPEESITQAKARKLVAAAQSYLAETGEPDADWRIDLLAIEMDQNGRVLRSNLVENAVTE